VTSSSDGTLRPRIVKSRNAAIGVVAEKIRNARS
jgi:hypothetical protein